MHNQLTKITKVGLQVLGYANDLMIVARGSFLELLTGVIQEALKFVDARCDRTGLAVNPVKIEIMDCTRNYKRNGKGLRKMEGQELAYKNSVKNLGIILNSNLSWNI